MAKKSQHLDHSDLTEPVVLKQALWRGAEPRSGWLTGESKARRGSGVGQRKEAFEARPDSAYRALPKSPTENGGLRGKAAGRLRVEEVVPAGSPSHPLPGQWTQPWDVNPAVGGGGFGKEASSPQQPQGTGK